MSESSPATLRALHLLDEAGVAQREDCEQPDVLQAFELVGNEWPVAAPAQNQHRADGLAERERNDRCVLYRKQCRREIRSGGAAIAKAAAEHDRPCGNSALEEGLPRQPCQ